jgi:hypothetical protein
MSHKGNIPDSDGINMWLEHIRKANQIFPEKDVDNEFKLELTTYFRDFLQSDNTNKKSWIHQLKNSFSGKFLFPEGAFHNFDVLNPGFHLFEDDREKWAYHRHLIGPIRPDSQNIAYDKFVKKFVDSFDQKDIKQNGREELLARFFRTLKFN